ncbi:MAG: hypothetical protein IJL74_04120 [Bacilli bacterium]|nr:hypothetical protein [Bacilli bacterium]
MDKEYGYKEQDLLNNFKDSLNKTVAEAEPSFKEAIPSAIDHSVGLLDTNVINQAEIKDSLDSGMDQGQGLAKTNEKVRVRTLEGPSHFPGMASSTPEQDNNFNPMNNSYPADDNPNVWKAGGYTETMILIGTGVLVLLVFMVSYLMLNYFG